MFTLGAMSVPPSRIDPTSPESVAGATFSTARRGFHPDEVRAALRDVAAELRALRARVDELETDLTAARAAPPVDAVEFDDETATRLLGEETVRVLQTARESAAQIRARAEESAARILRDATEESARVRSESEVEAARIRGDANRDADAEVSLAKQQGREMVNEARAYRERVLDELTRRREAARAQIDQLVQGRDRLLQVFERARLVAVDVVAELEPLVEPEEYLDLSPTTGPVPVVGSSPVLPTRRDDVAGTTADGSSDDDTAIDDSSDDDTAIDTAIDDTADESDAGRGSEPVDEFDEIDEIVDTADTADTVEVDDPGTDVDEPADDGASASYAVGEVDVELVEPEAPEPDRRSDENVISLFGSDRTTVAASTDESSSADATTATDVDGLFARLRADAIGTEPRGAEPPAVLPSASGDTATTDTATTAPPVGADDATEGTVFERRDADLVPLIVAAGRKLKRVLADEQNDVLGALRNPKRTGSLLDLLPERDAHVSRYVDAISAELVEAHRCGARSLDHGAEAPAPDLEAVRDLVAGSLITPLRDRLERADTSADHDAEEMIRSVRAVFREWKSQQIDDQLDDVLRLAHGIGVLAAAAVGAPMCWAVDPAGPACPDAEDNALAGAVPAGDAYPTGHRVAPAHAGCRCLLVPAGQ